MPHAVLQFQRMMLRSLVLHSSAWLLAVILSAVPHCDAQTITRGPYLQRGTPTSVIVRWRTDVATNSKVLYGLTPGSSSFSATQSGSHTEHRVEVSSLTPGTRYYYQVSSDAGVLAGGDAEHFFTTPPDGGDEPFHVWALGDAGSSGEQVQGENPNQAAVRDAFLNRYAVSDLAFMMMLGDNAYNSGTDTEYQRGFFNPYAGALRSLVAWSTQGNHDVPTNAYFEVFSLPRNAEAGGVASGTEEYYSFNYSNAHFIVLNSEIDAAGVRAAMRTWLAQDLTANTKPWTIAVFHHPPYSKGSHDSDSVIDSDGRLTWMRENVLPVLEAHGVDIVLSGHSHGYERSKFIDGHYGLSSTFTEGFVKMPGNGQDDGDGAYTKAALGPIAHSGTVYIVGGSSGKLTAAAGMNHAAMLTSFLKLASLDIGVNGNELVLKAIGSAGAVEDYFTIRKDPSRPRQVTGVTSQVTDATCSTQISWQSAPQAQSYTIYRSDKQYARGLAIADNVETTSFLDSGAAGGTLYYYSVRGKNPSGVGPWSDRASTAGSGVDSDGDGVHDCADGCPHNKIYKTPLGLFSDGSSNCSRALMQTLRPRAPKLTRNGSQVGIVLDSFHGKSLRYEVIVRSGKKIIRRSLSSKRSFTLRNITAKQLSVSYRIQFVKQGHLVRTRVSQAASV